MSNLTLHTQPPQAAVDQVIGLYNQEHLEQTVLLAESLAEQYPNALILYEILGASYIGLKDASKTIEIYQKALQLNPNHIDAYNNMGMALYDQGKFEEAVESYRKAIELEPDFADAHYNLGNALKQMGNMKQAIESYEVSITINPTDTEILTEYGNTLRACGYFDRAIACYSKALKINPNLTAFRTKLNATIKEKTEINTIVSDYAKIAKLEIGSAEIFNFTGAIFMNRGYLHSAIESYKQAVKLKPDYAEAFLSMGNALKKNIDLGAAMDSYNAAIKINPAYAEGYYNIGIVWQEMGKLDAAIESYNEALKIKPDYAEAYYNMAIILHENGDLKSAIDCCKNALKIKPDYAEAYITMGIGLRNSGDLEAALASYNEALKIIPGHADIHCDIGTILYKKGDLDAALESYKETLTIKPDYADAHIKIGLVLKDKGQTAAAIDSYNEALKIKPGRADAYLAIADALDDQSKIEEAIEAYNKALCYQPDNAETYYQLSAVLIKAGEHTRSVKAIEKAIALNSLNAMYRIAKLCGTLPLVWNPSELKSPLDDFENELQKLEIWAQQSENILELSRNVGAWHPFLLSYYPINLKGILERYGNLCSSPQDNNHSFDSPSHQCEKVMIGLVTAHLKEHSVYDIITKGLLKNINSEKFTIKIYCLGNINVDCDLMNIEAVEQLVQLGKFEDREIIKSNILSDKLDLLFYPEIGMNPTSVWLASQRLAPIQVVAWGHPVTTGLSNVDYYLSGELIEPKISQIHYTEKLVLLPGTGCVTEFSQIAENCNKIGHNLNGRTVFAVPHAPFKFHPDNDDIFVEIARCCPSSIFLIPNIKNYPGSIEKILSRIVEKFSEADVEYKNRFLVFPWLSSGEFLALLNKADVYLDLPTHSGYTTAWKAIHCGLPVVTLEGEFMRQRLAAGLLRQIEMPDTIASSKREYIEIAVRLAKQSRQKVEYAEYRAEIKSKASIADNNTQVVHAFETFVLKAVRKVGAQ